MSVIIRLQNLPWSANALDIRQFFSGLSIPEGGVHIVGGEQGDAFIAFSTDEDARQAFNLNGGKIKEVQIKLMLSSRTEMQKVIEAARNPLAAFMQRTPAPQPLPAIIPAAIPAAIPEIKKDDSKDKEKRDRRRSRSRSRDRKDRSRDRDRRDRRRRDRSRSRSRDRRDRRGRRDRSHSRERRSKDRDRRSKEQRHSEDKTGSSSNSSTGNTQKDPKVGIWENPVRNEPAVDLQDPQVFIDSFMPTVLEEARRNLNALNARSAILLGNKNGFQNQNEGFVANNQGRDSWNGGPGRPDQGGRHNFGTRLDRNLQGGNAENKFSPMNPRAQLNNRPFGDNPRGGFSRPISTRADGRNSRFEPPSSERPGLLERPALLERPGLLERPSSEHLKNCCVQLRPFYGGYGEIRRFFQGIFIHNTGIKFINDENGKRTGIVYVRFATPDGKENALQRSGAHLKHQPVEVAHLDDSIFDKTVDRYHPDYMKDHGERSEPSFKTKNPHVFNKTPSQFSCLAIEDLPLFTKEQDMLKIFSDFSMLSILLVNKQRHIIAYIKFTNAEDAKKAMAEKTKHIFDGKPLNIRPCPDQEYALISHEDGDPDDEDEDDEDDDDKPFVTSEYVSLSGLPLKTTDRDISDFFSDVAIVPNKIHLISSNLGFTGQAYCEFSSPRDADVALSKNGLPLGSGTISVKSVSKSEMEGTLGIVSRNTNINPNPNTIRPFFPRGFGHVHGPRGMGLMGHRPPMRRFLPPPVNPTDMATPGCTVLMENVPYKAGLDEILEFFDGFDVVPDNVLRRYNENGTPSGEAKVIFNSAEDAFQALRDRHMNKIRERTVYLSQC